MSYVKTNWVNGPNTATPITAANLNKLETQHDAALAQVAADVANGGSPIGASLIATIGGSVSAATDAAPLAFSLGNNLSKVGIVIDTGAAGQFDNLMVESLAPTFCPQEGRFAGVYTGYGDNTGVTRASIGLAWSDGGRTWTKAGVLFSGSGVSGSPDENGCTGPVLIFDGGVYHLFYIGLTATGYEGGTKTLCYATSPSLTSPVWTRHGTVMAAGGTGWRSIGVWHPSILKVGNLWYCFINASGNPSSLERIGYATAESLGGPWTFDDVNSPLIDVIAGTRIAGDPCVRRIPGGFRMDFFRVATDSTWASDFYATTTDALFPLGWTVGNGGNAILAPSKPYDAKFAHKPFILRLAGRTFHYYTAVSAGDHRAIALAVDPPFAPDLSGTPLVSGVTDGERLDSLIAALATLGVAATSKPVVSDLFTRADGALGTTEVGGKAWQVGGGGGWAIVGNEAKWTGATDGAAVVNSGLSDNYEIRFKVTQVNGTYPITIVARGSSATSYVKLFRNQTANYWSLADVTTTAGSVQLAWATDLVAGDVVTLRVAGNSYTLLVNGATVGTVNNFTYHNTSADTFQGFAGAGNLVAAVDDFYIASLS